jgi:hypothetical protein
VRTAGAWRLVTDLSAAGALQVSNADRGAAKLTAPLAAPEDFVEWSFVAEAGTEYRLWIRGRAAGDSFANDSAFVQFTGTIDSAGQPIYRIGSTTATAFVLEDCRGCGVSGWGWQDNGYGAGELGPTIRFAVSGLQTIRIQTREDGLSIDQIVLSPSRYLTRAPGLTKNDTTIVRSEWSLTDEPERAKIRHRDDEHYLLHHTKAGQANLLAGGEGVARDLKTISSQQKSSNRRPHVAPAVFFCSSSGGADHAGST